MRRHHTPVPSATPHLDILLIGASFPICILWRALYGALPAPFFVINGKTAPDVMMDSGVSSSVYILGSVGLVLGVASFAFIVSGRNFTDALVVGVVVPVAVHWTLFVFHALPLRSEKLFDLAGQLAFTFMAVYPLYVSTSRAEGAHPRQIVTTLCTLIWSVRLGTFLFLRFLERKSDFRFVKARMLPGYHFFTWTAQGLWCWFQGLPLLLLCSVRPAEQNAWCAVDWLGLWIWLLGFVIEAKADIEKSAFARRHPRSSTRPYIDTGLWYYSRHPNYAGETMVWIGVAFMCTSPLHKDGLKIGATWFSPLFSAVFLMQTSLPWLEARDDARYGASPCYWLHKLQTSAYWIMPKRQATPQMKSLAARLARTHKVPPR